MIMEINDQFATKMLIGKPPRTAVFKISRITKTFCRRLVNFTQESVDLDFVRYKKGQANSQPPVIILHGLLSSKNSWESVSEAISATTGREVISVDARNHGSSSHQPRNTYFDMVFDTVKLITTLGLKDVTLLGQSMGGRTAMVLSLLYPELVSNLLIVDISPVSMSQQLTNNFPKVLDVINSIHFEDIHRTADAIEYAREMLYTSGIRQKEVVDFILKNVGVKRNGTVGWKPKVKVLREYFPVLLKFPYIPGKIFPGPTLFVKAEHSDFMSAKDLPAIRNYYPQAKLKHIYGVRHNVQDEDPTTLLQYTIEFLDNNDKVAKREKPCLHTSKIARLLTQSDPQHYSITHTNK